MQALGVTCTDWGSESAVKQGEIGTPGGSRKPHRALSQLLMAQRMLPRDVPAAPCHRAEPRTSVEL